MLLVARRVGEALRIGTNIEVKVVAATRSRVMLAVTAPRELTIRRIYGKSDYKNANESEGLAEVDPGADGTATLELPEEEPQEGAEDPKKRIIATE